MGAAIGIVANNDSNERIIELWNKVSEFEDTPSMLSLNYPPHITFAIYPDIDVAHVCAAVRDVFAYTHQIRVGFDEIRFFDASPLVLWASPKDGFDLSQMHAAIHAKIDPELCDELYRPKQWIAHCTLATAILDVKREAAISFAATIFEPFDVVFDTIEVVEFPPVQIVERIVLV